MNYIALLAHWRRAGLSTRTAHILAYHGLASVADIRRFGEPTFRLVPKCGAVTLAEIGGFIGGWT